MDDVHNFTYDNVVSYQVIGSNKTDSEEVTSFNDQQNYMTLRGQQEGPSEYQEPQLCSKDTGEAVDVCNDKVKCCYGQKDELKKMKRCLCVLSFLVVVLFLITVSSLGLAAYGFDSIATMSSRIQEASSEGIINTTKFNNHNFTLFKEQLTQEATQIWENILSQLNTINTTLMSSVTSLHMTILSLQLAIRSQPSMQYM